MVNSQESDYFVLELVCIEGNDVFVESVMLDLLHLDELDELVSIPCQVLVVKQSCLLHRNYFICHRMHQKNAS